jgi:hypothetical protein
MSLTKATYYMVAGSPVNVLDYGAVGNGSTNDAAALQSAFTAAAGKSVYLPPQTYKVNSALTIPANTVVTGYGATLDFSSAGHIAALTLSGNVTLVGFKIIGAGNASYNANGIAIKCYGTDNSPSAPTYIIGPTIRDVEITEFGSYGIDCKYNVYGQIDGCKITEIGYMGANLLSCNRFIFTNNHVSGISPGTGGNGYGISVSSSEGSVTADPIPVFNTIVGNIIEDVTVWTGIDTHGGSNLLVANNIVHNCKYGIKITDRDVGGLRTIAPKNITVANNVIDDNGLGLAPAIVVNGAPQAGVIVDYAENVSITGNVIRGHGISNISSEGAIRCYGTLNLSITGNTIRRPNLVGITLQLDNIGFNVSGNVITDPKSNTDTTRCIYTHASNNQGTIVGNTFVFENSGIATSVAEWAVEKGANGGGSGADSIVTVANNNLVNVQPGHLQLSNFGMAYSGGDTSPSVKNTTFMSISNGGATTITNFDDGYEGQVIMLYFTDGNTTINRDNCYLAGGTNFTSSADDTLTLQRIGSNWYEVARSVNA